MACVPFLEQVYQGQIIETVNSVCDDYDDYYQLCDEAKLPYDFTLQPRINKFYTDDVYIGSYVKGQTNLRIK